MFPEKRKFKEIYFVRKKNFSLSFTLFQKKTFWIPFRIFLYLEKISLGLLEKKKVQENVKIKKLVRKEKWLNYMSPVTKYEYN